MLKLLTSEAYIGNIVWGKSTCKLGTAKRRTSGDNWIRHENVFAPVVDEQVFRKVQAEINRRGFARSSSDILEHLRKLVRKHGLLSKKLIDGDGYTTSSIICHRFGSLRKAYAALGIDEFPSNQHAKFKVQIELAAETLRSKLERFWTTFESQDKWVNLRSFSRRSNYCNCVVSAHPKGDQARAMVYRVARFATGRRHRGSQDGERKSLRTGLSCRAC